MKIAAILMIVCLFVQLLSKLIRYLCRDNNYNQNIWIQAGRSVGDERPESDMLLPFGQSSQGDTILRKRPKEHVTSSFSCIYIQLCNVRTGECYEAYLEHQLEIGRSARSTGEELFLNDPMVSRKHCLLYRKGEQIMIQDLGSTNHTYVNGCLVTGAMPLSHGDQIGFGTSVYQFQCFYQR